MMRSSALLTALLSVLALAANSPSQAQQDNRSWGSARANIDSAAAQGQGNRWICPTGCGMPLPGTPLFAPPPSAHFYALGVQALGKREYEFATDMFKAAASWASKPAEYRLGMMYFHGDGVPTDRPLGAVWMTLAAERGDLQYVKARNAMIGQLASAEVPQTDALLSDLRKTYGDKVALVRANRQRKWDGTYFMTWTGTHRTRK